MLTNASGHWLRLAMLLVLYMCTGMSSYAQDKKQTATEPAIDYQQYYSLLDKNISRYNQMSDSLFGRYDKKRWLVNYLHRAQVTSQLRAQNEEAIKNLKNFLQDDALTPYFIEALTNSSDALLPTIHDDFLDEELLQFMLEKEEELKAKGLKIDDQYIKTKLALAIAKYSTGAIGDPQSQIESVKLFRDILTHLKPGRDIPLTPSSATSYLTASYNFNILTVFVHKGVITLEEMLAARDELAGLLQDPVFCQGVDPSVVEKAHSTLDNQISALLRNVYLPDKSHRYDAIRDSLMTSYLDQYDQHPELESELDLLQRKRLTLMRQQTGRISVMEALAQSEKITDSLSVHMKNEKQVKDKFNSMLECVYYVHLSGMSYNEKRAKIQGYCATIINDLANFQYDNAMPQLTSMLSSVAAYPYIHRYLHSDERKEFLEKVLFFSQPFTHAHSATVTHIAMTILQSVIDHQPELLVGMWGFKRGREVQENQQRIKDFFREGAMLHDVGKTRITDIVRIEYRQLTDHEFSLIRRHPEFGLEFLRVDSSLMELHDLVLGHHKWYDGKGGYPASFDNTRSPYRVLIDILSIADSMEAATSRLGRNYRKKKRYLDVLGEFRAQAGTRYSPYIIQHIEVHPYLSEQLNAICDKGWEDIYYGIFNNNIVSLKTDY